MLNVSENEKLLVSSEILKNFCVMIELEELSLHLLLFLVPSFIH